MAGLAAAVEASTPPTPWQRIYLYEAARHAGGRCRSFFDEVLDRTIDNGNHLLLGANRSALDYLTAIGGMSAMASVSPACIPFLDLGSGETWELRPNAGRLPWWLPSQAVPGARMSGKLASLRLLAARSPSSVSDCLAATGVLYQRFWVPLATAVLNTDPRCASARLLRSVAAVLLTSGEAGLRPYFAREGLSPAFVDPALRLLQSRGAALRLGWRARRLGTGGDRVVSLDFGPDQVPLGAEDAVVLAVPPEPAANLLPGLRTPTEASPILNLHFRVAPGTALPGGEPLLGLIGGTPQWLFLRGDILSVTISAAAELAAVDSDEIAALVWREVATVVDCTDAPLPPCRVIKERRATFAQTPDQIALRPPQRTRFTNLALAGDWIDTGLPATIESAVRSGRRAARLLARR